VELLTTSLPVGATVFVAIVGYVQWRRGERRQAENELARLELEHSERRRTARAPYSQRRLEALQELISSLRELEIQSRRNTGSQDLRAEVPRINTFLIQHGEVLEDEERLLAQQFLEGLMEIDRVLVEGRRREEDERQELAGRGIDMESLETSWTQTGKLPLVPEIMHGAQKWESAQLALEERLRQALQGI
jgi:hypothetical protein